MRPDACSRCGPRTSTATGAVTPALLALAGIPLAPDEETLPVLDLAADWDGDGALEILLPLLDRVAIARRGAAGWAVAGELRLGVRESYGGRGEGYDPRAR